MGTLVADSVGISHNTFSYNIDKIGAELETEPAPPPTEIDSSEKTIEKIKSTFEINVHHTYPTNIEGDKSYPQDPEELTILLNTLYLLPPITFTSNKLRDIYLFKINKPSQANGMIFSGYDNQKITITLSTDYNRHKHNTGIQFEYYRTQGRFFSALLIHEFGHLITENYPDMYQAWIKQTKWSQDSEGRWSNYYPEQIVREAEAWLYPWEDFSTALSLATLNIELFKKISPCRYYFFQNSPLFNDWPIMKDIDKENSDPESIFQ